MLRLREPWNDAVRWGGGKSPLLEDDWGVCTDFLVSSPSDGECLGPPRLCNLYSKQCIYIDMQEFETSMTLCV